MSQHPATPGVVSGHGLPYVKFLPKMYLNLMTRKHQTNPNYGTSYRINGQRHQGPEGQTQTEEPSQTVGD